MDKDRLERLIEFFVIGVVLGVTEDLIAITLATDATITPQMIGIIILVAIPFAGLSELVVDRPSFTAFEEWATKLTSR